MHFQVNFFDLKNNFAEELANNFNNYGPSIALSELGFNCCANTKPHQPECDVAFLVVSFAEIGLTCDQASFDKAYEKIIKEVRPKKMVIVAVKEKSHNTSEMEPCGFTQSHQLEKLLKSYKDKKPALEIKYLNQEEINTGLNEFIFNLATQHYSLIKPEVSNGAKRKSMLFRSVIDSKINEEISSKNSNLVPSFMNTSIKGTKDEVLLSLALAETLASMLPDMDDVKTKINEELNALKKNMWAELTAILTNDKFKKLNTGKNLKTKQQRIEARQKLMGNITHIYSTILQRVEANEKKASLYPKLTDFIKEINAGKIKPWQAILQRIDELTNQSNPTLKDKARSFFSKLADGEDYQDMATQLHVSVVKVPEKLIKEQYDHLLLKTGFTESQLQNYISQNF